MSLVEPVRKHMWLSIGIAVALLIALVIGASTLRVAGFRDDHDPNLPGPASRRVPQAEWRIAAYPAGIVGRPTKAQRKVLERRRPQLRKLVQRVYYGLFLQPEELGRILDEDFTPRAAAALRDSGAGASSNGVVTTTLRKARIAIQATGGARLAVASVTIRAASDEAPVPVTHRSDLWLQHEGGDWKVVAFDVLQKPVTKPKVRKKDGSGGKASQPAKRPAGKKRRK